jgi:hypothetical protein
MGRFSGVLLVTDYDDTLYDNAMTISPENRAAIHEFVSQGGRFTVATGRSYVNFAIQMAAEKLEINAPVIISNGASIYDFETKTFLWEKELAPVTADRLEEVCRRFPELGFEAYHEEEIYTYRPNNATRRHLTRCHLTAQEMEIRQMTRPWTKVILQHEDMDYLRRVQADIQARWGEDYEVTFSNHILLELTDRGADKGHAVRWLGEYLGIAPGHIYCAGNGMNDIPMLAVSAVPYAPQNCYQEVKDWVADHGTPLLPSCDDHCIARLIQDLKARYQ